MWPAKKTTVVKDAIRGGRWWPRWPELGRTVKAYLP